jgi:hypothetical protein
MIKINKFTNTFYSVTCLHLTRFFSDITSYKYLHKQKKPLLIAFSFYDLFNKETFVNTITNNLVFSILY